MPMCNQTVIKAEADIETIWRSAPSLLPVLLRRSAAEAEGRERRSVNQFVALRTQFCMNRCKTCLVLLASVIRAGQSHFNPFDGEPFAAARCFFAR
jgi:hypothetical protein